ncbi:unnamed protein product [Lathyrus sativus]|nr:unnamed protein product [Lathyrus sativus]
MFTSISNHRRIHDVFLNFRGKDTRRKIVSHLYAALKNAGINTYIDNQLFKGTELGYQLLRGIENSRIAIIVFSKNYTQSSWCLNELQKVMECHRTSGQLVLPVFYNVDPSVVRHQKGDFGKVLRATAKKVYFRSEGKEKMENMLSNWSTALTQAAYLSGWNVTEYR